VRIGAYPYSRGRARLAWGLILILICLFPRASSANQVTGRLCRFVSSNVDDVLQQLYSPNGLHKLQNNEFGKLGPSDLEAIRAGLAKFPADLSVYHPDNLSAWSKNLGLEASRRDGAILLHARGHRPADRSIFLEPIGVPDVQKARLIRNFLAENPTYEGKPAVFLHISEPVRKLLANEPGLDTYEVKGKSEYVYEARTIATLQGLDTPRKEVARFFRTFPVKGETAKGSLATLENTPPQDRAKLIQELKTFLDQWAARQPAEETSRHDFQDQMDGTRKMLDHFFDPGSKLLGKVALVDGKVQGFTLAGRINPTTMVVYVEAAINSVDGKKVEIGKTINQRIVQDAVLDSLAKAPGVAERNAHSALVAFRHLAESDSLPPADFKREMQSYVDNSDSASLPANIRDVENNIRRALQAKTYNHNQVVNLHAELLPLRRRLAYDAMGEVKNPLVVQHVNHQEDGGEVRDAQAKLLYHPIAEAGKNYSVQSAQLGGPMKWNTYEDER